MKGKLRICGKCGNYTMKNACPKCGSETSSAHPPQFSPVDKYGYWRRKLIENQSLNE